VDEIEGLESPKRLGDWLPDAMGKMLEADPSLGVVDDVVSRLLADLPFQLIPQTVRPTLTGRVRAHFRVRGYVSKRGDDGRRYVRPEELDLEGIVDVAAEKIAGGEALFKSARRDLGRWCDAHPTLGFSADDLFARAESLAAVAEVEDAEP
jgi:hypothetical protein